MSTSADDATPGRRAAARASTATQRRAVEGGPFRYHVCSLEPGGEYEEVIVEVGADEGPRFFATDDGARMTEVAERYVEVRRTSEIRSMHELDLDEMVELEDELGFARPVAGFDPRDDPAWTEYLDVVRAPAPVDADQDTAADASTDDLAEPDASPDGAMVADASLDDVMEVDASPDDVMEADASLDEADPLDEETTVEATTAPNEDDAPEPADAGEPTHIGEDVEMTMESDADWTFEQFEAVVAGSAPAAAAPSAPAPVAASPARPGAPASAPTSAAPAAPPAPAATQPAAPAAPQPAAPASTPTHAPAAPAARASRVASPAPVEHEQALQIGLAQGIAHLAHRDQTDKHGAPYIDHPGRVAEAFDPVGQPVEAAVAWLHDVLEDTELTADALRGAGVSHEVIDAVQVLTRTPGLADADYYARIRVHAVARAVKLADIADNTAPWRLRKLDHATQARLAEKYALALAALGD